MKMIRPLRNVMDLATNDAPMDPYTEWQPEGRDLLGIYKNIGIKAVGNTLYFAGVKGGVVTFAKQDLATGVVTKIVEGIEHSYQNSKNPLDAAIEIDIVAGSDIAYVTFLYSGDDCRINIVDLTSGVAVKVIGSPARPIRVGNECVFSAGFAVGVDQFFGIYSYNTSAGTTTLKVSIHAADFFTAIGSISSHWLSVTTHTLKSSDGSIYLIASGLTKRSATTLYGTVVLRVPPNWGQPVGSAVLNYTNSNNAKLQAINEERGHLIYSENNRTVTRFLSSNTLTHIDPPAGSSIAASSIQVHGDKMFVRSISTSPTWTAKLLSNYADSFTLPEAPNRGAQLAFADDYIVQSQNSGVVLHDPLNNYELIAQQNPNVVKGDTYIYNDKVYEVLTNNNVQPDEGAAAEPPTWLDRGFINPLRMFDGKLDSVTTAPNNLNVTIDTSSLISALAVFNVEAATLKLTMTDPVEGLVYDSGLIDMQGGNTVDNWFDYFFAPYIPKADYAVIDLPAYPDATIAVEMAALNGEVKLGELVLGRAHDLGVAQYGTSVGIIDFSRKETDEFGNFKIVPRRFSKRAEYDVKIDSRRISGVQRTLAGMRSTPAVYIGDIEREETIIYGYYRSFDIVISAPSISDASITVEGL